MAGRRKGMLLLLTGMLLFAAAGCSGEHIDRDGAETESAALQTEGASAAEKKQPDGKDEVKFETDTLDGEKADESIFADAKLTMLNMWATYCSPCIDEMPDLGELAGEYDNAEFQIVGIISDVQTGDDTTAAQKIVSETGASYRHLLLNQEVYQTFMDGVTAVPTTLFVDAEGNQVGEAYMGARGKEEWKEIIDALLAQM